MEDKYFSSKTKMGAAVAKIFFKTGEDDIIAKYDSVNQIPCTSIRGEKGIVSDHLVDKKLYIIVNVASK